MNTGVGFSDLPRTVNSLSFTGAYPHYFLNGNGGVLTLASGTTGITVADTSGGGFGTVDFNNSLNIALGASQTWATNGNLNVNGNVSGGFALTKSGTGYLALNGNNTYSGGTTISAGLLYLGQNNSAGTGTITLGSGATLGTTFSDVTLTNSFAISDGAQLGDNGGSSLELGGTVTLGSTTTTLNIGNWSDVKFTGTLTGPAATALTVHSAGSGNDGTGIAIMAGTTSGNIASITADNSAVAFMATTALPASIQASNGGYVSVVNTGAGATNASGAPSDTAVIDLIANKAAFNGTIGFDTGDQSNSPHIFSGNIDLTGFTAGNVRIGSATSAILTGTITPVAQSYDFGGYAGQGGFLAVQSVLADHGGATGVSVVSPVASNGAAQNGLGVILQDANTFTGNISVSYSAVILDSTGAAGAGSGNFSLGDYSYMGYTESPGYADFATFKSHLTSSTSTSILGIDTHATLAAALAGSDPSIIAARTVGDAIDLSGFSSGIYLGTVSGATLTGTITAPTADHTLRLVNLGDFAKLTVASTLASGNVDAVVVGLPGSNGAVVLSGTNTYANGTVLLGGGLLADNNSALGTGAITATNSTGSTMSLGASTNGVALANAIAVTGNLNIGTGGQDDNGNYAAGATSITLGGVISGTGRLYLYGPTTLSGANTYTGGTYVQADTTVTNNTGLGNNGFVDLGYTASNGSRSVLTFSGAATAPTIGILADASAFLGSSAGTGDIHLAGTVTSLTVNQTSNQTFSGLITGTSGAATAALIKNGGAQLTLLGANGGQFTGGTTINAGNLAIGDGNATSATFSGNVAIAGGSGLFFRPGNTQTMAYSGNITGAGNVTINGNNGGIVSVAGSVGTNFTGSTTVNNGKLQITGDNLWSSASGTTVNSTLQLDGDQTIKNLSSGATSSSVIISTTNKVLTVNSATGTTFAGVISGNGGLTKTGAGTTFTLNNNNTYAGPTSVSAGTLQLGSGSSNGSVSGTIDIASGAGLVLNHSGAVTVANAISGAGTVTNSFGTTTLSGTNSYTGGTTIQGGTTVIVSADNNLGGASGGITFNSGTLQTNAALGTVSRNIALNGAGTVNTNGFVTTFSGTLSGGNSFTKTGSGKLILSGNSGSGSFTGSTLVNGGSLFVDGNLTSSSGATVSSGATMLGSGSIGAFTVNAGGSAGVLSSVGVPATFTASSANFQSGSNLGLYITDAGAGLEGTGWGLLSISGVLNFNASPFTIVLNTIDGSGAHTAANFNPASSATFLVASAAGGINGFNSGNVGFNTSGFLNSFTGSFSASVTGNNLYVNYSPTAIPEPATSAVLAGLGVIALAAWRRRRGVGV